MGPPLSSLDAELAFQQEAVPRSKDARKQAQMNAAAQEARGMLGKPSHLIKLVAQPLSLNLPQPNQVQGAYEKNLLFLQMVYMCQSSLDRQLGAISTAAL